MAEKSAPLCLRWQRDLVLCPRAGGLELGGQAGGRWRWGKLGQVVGMETAQEMLSILTSNRLWCWDVNVSISANLWQSL